MILKLITPPAVNSITLAEAKEHLRVLHSDDDSYITTLIKTAESSIRDATYFCGSSQTWEMSCKVPFNRDPIILPIGPLQSVTQIRYLSNSSYLDWDINSYSVLTSSVGKIYPKKGQNYPKTDTESYEQIKITFVSGHLTVDVIPDAFKQCVKVLISQSYWKRDQEYSVDAVRKILSAYRLPESIIM